MTHRSYATVEDLWDNVRKTDECWWWQEPLQGEGYGRATLGGRRVLVHRAIYQSVVGSIPAGLQIDHECHNRASGCPGGRLCQHRRCVRPDHLRAVTQKINVLAGLGHTAQNARKTHCPNGHPFDETNTYLSKSGERQCRRCHLAHETQRRLDHLDEINARRRARRAAGLIDNRGRRIRPAEVAS